MISFLIAARDILIAVILSWMGFGQTAPETDVTADKQKQPAISLYFNRS